jgi:galactose mutarotase-like enzyme
LISPADVRSTDRPNGKPVRLQSTDLCVDVLPDNGGKIASLRCMKTGTEFLVSGSTYDAKAQFAPDAPFEESDCAGMDECLPTISISGPETLGGGVPDHGDLWRLPWRVVRENGNEVVLTANCFSRPLSFTRRLSVQAAVVRLDYRIQNLADASVPFLYACHPLFAIDSGDRVILPSEIDRVRLHYSRGDRAGHAAESIAWPHVTSGNGQIELDRIEEISAGTAEMLYAEKLARGICAIYRTHRKQAVVVRFDPQVLPYLGLWICCGGWPDDPAQAKQHAVALEPTVAAHGSLAAATAAGEAPVLAAGHAFEFTIRMEVLGCDKPWTYDDVKQYVNDAPAL